MKKRSWPFLFLVVAGLFVLAGMSACRRQSLEKLHTTILKHEKRKLLNRLGTGYKFDFPAWPQNVPSGPIRILAREGLLEDYAKYDPTDEDHRANLEGGKYELLPAGNYRRLSDEEASDQTTNFYVHLRPLSIRQFEKHYKTKVLITYLGEHEHLYGAPETKPHDTTRYDLIFADRNQILPLISKKGIQKFNHKNIPNLEDVRVTMDSKFPKVPEDSEFFYSIPYYWGTFGFFYNLGHVPVPPDNWTTLFHFEDIPALMGKVSFVDNREIMFGLAMLHLKGISFTERGHEKADTDKLIKIFEDIKKSPASFFGKKQRLTQLLKAFSELHDQEEAEEKKTFKTHPVRFNSPSKPHSPNSKGLEDYYTAQMTNAEVQASVAEVPQEETIQEVIKILKRCILFGADFRQETDLRDLISEEDYLSLGLGGAGFLALQGNPDVRFQIPRSDNIVVLKVFVMPEEVTAERKARAEFFLNYLLQPKVAADLVSFDLLASTCSDAREFISTELLNSSVYSVHDSSMGYYLPIIDDSDLEDHWVEVKEFYKDVSKILESR